MPTHAYHSSDIRQSHLAQRLLRASLGQVAQEGHQPNTTTTLVTVVASGMPDGFRGGASHDFPYHGRGGTRKEEATDLQSHESLEKSTLPVSLGMPLPPVNGGSRVPGKQQPDGGIRAQGSKGLPAWKLNMLQVLNHRSVGGSWQQLGCHVLHPRHIFEKPDAFAVFSLRSGISMPCWRP